jgi:hypothetical protein
MSEISDKIQRINQLYLQVKEIEDLYNKAIRNNKTSLARNYLVQLKLKNKTLNSEVYRFKKLISSNIAIVKLEINGVLKKGILPNVSDFEDVNIIYKAIGIIKHINIKILEIKIYHNPYIVDEFY